MVCIVDAWVLGLDGYSYMGSDHSCGVGFLVDAYWEFAHCLLGFNGSCQMVRDNDDFTSRRFKV